MNASSKLDEVVYYSNPDHRQDQWVIENVFQGKRDGFFVEAGAAGASNTKTLENYFGWTGIAVEPHPGSFLEIQKERNCILENICLTDHACEVSFMINDEIPGTSMVVDMSKMLNEVFYDPGKSYSTIAVEGLPLWTILEKHGAPKVIDYLSLDIEGSEWMALKDFPFEKYSFRCMTIERGAHEYLRLRDLLLDNNYRLVKIAQTDDYWVHPTLGYRAPVFDRLHVALRSTIERHPFLLRIARRIRRLL